jgi:hypothetical protein
VEHHDTPDPIEWATAGLATVATTRDWTYSIIDYGNGASLRVRRAGTRPSAMAYKFADYTSAAHAKRAAVRFERTFTHHDGHLKYRADPLRRVRGWYWHPRHNAGHPDHLGDD